MKTKEIKKGFTFLSSEGYTVCDSYDNGVVYCVEHCEETGDESASYRTLKEIADDINTYEGEQVKLVWAEEE